MAAYVLKVIEASEDSEGEDVWGTTDYHFVEAGSMKEAVEDLGVSAGVVEVWRLAGDLTPNTFTLRTETRVVVEGTPSDPNS